MIDEQHFNRSLFEICQTMVSSLELSEVLDTILELTLSNLQADAGSILLYDEESDELRMLAARGLPPGVVSRGFVSRKGSIAERVMENDEPLILNGVAKHASDARKGVKPAKAIRSAICAPLRAKGQVIGTVNLNRYREETGNFDEPDVERVMILASHAALSIENARLYQSNLEKTRLAAIGQTVAGISHCVKNMLTGLRGGLGLIELASEAKDWEANGKGVGLLKRNVERVSMLVMDMLDYSKDRKVPCRRDASVALLADEVFDVADSKARERGVTLQTDIEPEADRVHVDADQIFRCLLNLVENAVDAAERSQASVTVGCRVLGRREIEDVFGEDVECDALGKVVCLSVADTGSGHRAGEPDAHFRRVLLYQAVQGHGPRAGGHAQDRRGARRPDPRRVRGRQGRGFPHDPARERAPGFLRAARTRCRQFLTPPFFLCKVACSLDRPFPICWASSWRNSLWLCVWGPGTHVLGGWFEGQHPPTRECFVARQRNEEHSVLARRTARCAAPQSSADAAREVRGQQRREPCRRDACARGLAERAGELPSRVVAHVGGQVLESPVPVRFGADGRFVLAVEVGASREAVLENVEVVAPHAVEARRL